MKYKILLLSIAVLAAFLRFINLGKLPSSFTPDELAQGYTAYSILITGQDEWGSQNWLSLRSFGDYKPPLQTLLMIPSIKVFGLTPFAVRFPNALLSVFTIILTYLIADILFKNRKISLLSALFLAVSPWSIPLSRIALEANLVIFIISLATFLFLKSVNKNSKITFIISIILFGVSLFTYHSAKIFTPLFLIVLFFYLKIYKNKFFTVALISIFSFCLLFQYQVTHQTKSNRTSDIAIFNPTDHWQSVSDNQFEMINNGLPHSLTRVFYNKIVYLYEVFVQSYFSYFSPQFLITHGAGETTYGMIPGFGVLGLIPTIGLIFVLIILAKKQHLNYHSDLIFLLLTILIPPFIAAVAKGQYSGNRVSLMMPFIQIISAAGLVIFLKDIPKYSKKIFIILSGSFFVFTTLVFLQRYFYEGNQILANGMLYGHQQAIAYINKLKNVDHVIYSRKLSEPQTYVLFFNQIDPKNTQSESSNWINYESKNLSFLDQLGEYKLDKYIFREINISSDLQLSNTAIVGRPEEFQGVKPDYIIYYPYASKQEASIYISLTDK